MFHVLDTIRLFPYFHVVGLDCFGSCSGQIWTIAEDKQVLMISYTLHELRKRPSLIRFHPFSSFSRKVMFHVRPHSKRPRLGCFPPHLPNEATRSPSKKGHATSNMKLKDIGNNLFIYRSNEKKHIAHKYINKMNQNDITVRHVGRTKTRKTVLTNSFALR